MLDKNTGAKSINQSAQAAFDDGDDVDLIQVLATLWRGKWTILLCAFALTVAGAIYAFGLAVPKYAASTTLALQARNQPVVDLESVLSGVSTDDAALKTELEVIKSRSLLEKLVAELDLLADPEFNATLRPEPAFSPRDSLFWLLGLVGLAPEPDAPPTAADILNQTVAELGEAITATNLHDTYVFEIGARTETPAKSAALTNTLARLYIEDQIALKFDATENAVSWLSDRSIALEQELREKENAVKEARSASGVISPEALQALNIQAKDVRDRMADMSLTQAALEVRAERLLALLADGTPAEIAAEVDDTVITRLWQDQTMEAGPLLERMRDRLRQIAARLQTDVERNRQQLAALELSHQRLQERFDAQSAEMVQLQQLERDAEATRVLYETVLTRLKETAVQRGLQQADSRVLSAATPGMQVAPRRSVILGLSFFLGALLGAGAILLRQMMHNGYRSAEDLEIGTGLPVLGEIPRLPIRARPMLLSYLKDKPTSAAAEAIRNLRTSVLLSNIDSPPQVIMSTSSLPGEGKTTQAIALAMNLSGLGKKVLLIEGDIRRRTFSKYFDARSEGGLLTALSGEAPLKELVSHDARVGADVLMGEKSSANAADVFSSEKFHSFISMARQAYDFIVLDTPPVLVVPDARVIGQSADAIIFSVHWDKTSKAQVQEALRQFSSVNLRVTGVVLAQVDPKRMARYYGYGSRYGTYSRYGRGYYEA
ncbi:GumC family protein [Pseudodonghicola flavimaris]|uniref:non-specific protein-tyrosine kinase n=1 Tax=Pseudodonghicola flavimaris TaxID=3050036 RepID=A0ABT7EZJ0_9RHOB|nr:polysaccharide biosynthesis tyrosine autokinase [Pseudodonghicola flavimaris]MDK3017757.1 polysaccharide biosynthesis tyrosine autokinase [Pseudodonghicola flavimaris]